MYKNGTLVGPLASVIEAMQKNPLGSFGGYTAGMADSALQDWGIYRGLIERGPGTRDVDTDGVYLPFATDGTDNYVSAVRIFSSARPPHQTASNPIMVMQVRLVDLSAVRYFFGFINGDFNAIGSDDPGAAHAGIMFSTDRADVNWQLVTDDGTDQNLEDVIIAPSTDTIIIVLSLTTAEATVAILDTNFTVLGSARSDTNLPPAAEDLFVIHGVAALEAAIKTFVVYWAFGANLGNG